MSMMLLMMLLVEFDKGLVSTPQEDRTSRFTHKQFAGKEGVEPAPWFRLLVFIINKKGETRETRSGGN